MACKSKPVKDERSLIADVENEFVKRPPIYKTEAEYKDVAKKKRFGRKVRYLEVS